MIKKYPKQIGVGIFKITEEAKKNVQTVLDNERLSYGSFSQEFEAEFAKIHEQKFSLFLNSGTSALQVALNALKIKHNWKNGDEVLVPALTFVATVNTISQNKLKPVFVEVDPISFNIDPKEIGKRITKRTRCIVPVSLCGLPCEIDEVNKIAKKYKLKVLEDACETMFVKHKGKAVGSKADIACYSTYVAHMITTGVCGFVATNNKDYAILSRSLINHGRDNIYIKIDDDKGKKGKKLAQVMEKRFSFIHEGYSYRMTEMEAALGVVELKHWKTTLKKRKDNAEKLKKGLKEFEKYLQSPTWPKYSDHGFMMFPLVVKGINRDKLTLFLEEMNIETRPLVPLINQPYFKKLYGDLSKKYPVADHLTKNAFYIGSHPGLTDKEIKYIICVFKEYFKKYGK